MARPRRPAAPRPALALRPLASAARRLLDRRGDLGRHRARALDVDPAPAAEDGSPPLYYMLLGIWVRLFGDSEAATHTLSLVFGLACVPLAYFAARAVFGRRAGLAAAVLAAIDPFLTYYAQETRMYELEALLSLVVAWSYVEGSCVRGGGGLPVFVLSTRCSRTATTGGSSSASGSPPPPFAFARDRLRLFGIAAAGVAVLYAPWLPTLLSQARHTGAPWSTRPSFHDLFLCAGTVIGGDAPYVALVLVGGAALGGIVRARADAGAARDRRAAHRRRRHDRRRVRRLADLAGVDGALLRGHLRAGRARRRATRSRVRAGSASRRWSRSSSSSPATPSRTTRRTRRGSPPEHRPYLKAGDLIISTHPGAGAGAALLPRSGVPVGDDARPGCPIR